MNSTAQAADALEAFQNHCVRIQWDTLLSQAGVEGGGTHPYMVPSRSLSQKRRAGRGMHQIGGGGFPVKSYPEL
ncbi:hypothetical protein CUN63_01185 [Pseudomonas sp. ACM7]|nr:hypothetical protein CUN63_01185 [Pseudomonas sp. ACM7]